MGYVQWAQADNGDIPAWKMVDVDGNGNLLNPAAAAFFHAWDADYFAITGVHITISEGFRNIAEQERLYALYLSGRGNLAAVPHTSSHGMGLAVDVNSWVYGNSSGTTKHNALVESGLRHGWSWYTVGKPSGEPWHFNYTGDPTLVSVADYNARFGGGSTPIAKDWFDMASQADLDSSVDKGTARIIAALKPSATIAGRTADGGIGIFGADFVEDGVSDPSRLGKRGRRIFRNVTEYGTFKRICDTINQNGGDAPVLPEFDKVVFLDEPGWAAFNAFYQEP